MSAADPHAGQPVRRAGAPLGQGGAAVLLVHGRGATAESILALADALGRPDLTYLAPQAAGWTWYPHAFLAPLTANEPWLSSALRAVERVAGEATGGGVPRERVVLAGFSQGACLALEFAARHAGRWGGVVGLSGGLLGSADGAGPPPYDKRFDYDGTFAGTPVFLGCDARDAHIPLARVRETAAVFERLGTAVDARIYPDLGHAVNDDELAAFRALLDALAPAAG